MSLGLTEEELKFLKDHHNYGDWRMIQRKLKVSPRTMANIIEGKPTRFCNIIKIRKFIELKKKHLNK